MIAKFDSYRKFETPMLHVCNPGCVYTGRLLSNVAGILSDVSDIEIVFNFNAPSELNFRAYKVKRNDAEENLHALSLYRSLRNKRLIFVDGIGFFAITEVAESYKDGIHFKDIKAESCEAELRNKGVPYIPDGTYQFYTGEAGNPGVIEMLMSIAPMWTLGDIDLSVKNRWRTFEDVDITKNILGFMLEDLQDAYECLFEFDPINRIVSVYDQANYVHETDIHITKDDLISELEITESSDDLYTALSVTGDDALSINAVNPLGTNVIYNFDYYLDWMTPGLSEKVSAWQALVDAYSQQYYNIQLARHNSLTQKSNLESERARLDIQLTMYSRCRDNIVAEARDEDIATYNNVIIEAGGVPIPETTQYTWIKFADDGFGTNLTDDPYGKNYIGLAYDKGTQVASLTPTDYEWHTFRSGETFPRVKEGQTTYTWVVFGDSPTSGMSNDPDEKAYIGITLDKTSSTKSTEYGTYTWQLLNKGNLGVPQVLMRIVSLIEEVNDEIAANEDALDEVNETINARDAQAGAIHEAVAMSSYFTIAELDELSNYISEGNYTDEYVTVTESMTYAERFQQMKTLYDRAKVQLEKISVPTQEFDVDVENFIFIKDFERWSDQLETGCLINVELETNDVAALFLSSFEVNYEDKKLKMTFGNRYNRFDPKALFNDVLGNISKTANTLSYIKDTIYPIKSGEFNKMKEALEMSRTLSKNSVLSSDNEQVIIDDTGYTGRRKNPDGTIDPKQIKINGRNIVFTDDAWETCKTAIGEIILSGGASTYGVNAEVLLGNLIMGNELHIVNGDGEDMFSVTEDNIMLRVGEAYATKEATISGVAVLYCRASSAIVCDDTTITVDWSTTAPAWVSGEYIWQKTVTTYADGSPTESEPTCLSGASGQSGVGISGATVSYAKSTDGEHHPTTGWSETVPTLEEGKYLWTRTVTTYTDGATTTSYSVSRNGLNGLNGTNGNNTAVVSLYKRSTSAPAVDWTTTLTYNFSTNRLSSVPAGWYESIPSGDDPIYMTAATASSNTSTDTIAKSEWATPILLAKNGNDGEPGTAGAAGANTATVFLYQRAASASGLSKPTTALTYTFTTGVLSGNLGNWSQSIPATNGNPCFVIQATAVGVGTTDTITASEWSDIVSLVADGENGTDGVGIASIETEYYLSTSDSGQSGGQWTTTPPVWESGKYIWTRSHIYWDDESETTTAPVLDLTYNNLGETLDSCITDIRVNKTGIEQNTQYYQRLNGQVSKINAYIQTGVIGVDEQGIPYYGVKIGENLARVEVYIVNGSTTFSSGWLSETDGGMAFTPTDSVLYMVKTPGTYYNRTYKWNGTVYEEAQSEGNVSSIFTSSELGFYDTGTKTAYFSNKNLNVKTVRTNKILFSNDVIADIGSNNWQIGVDNGFYLKWIGA